MTRASIRGLLAVAFAMLLVLVPVPSGAQALRVTYVDLSRADPSTIRVAPGETIRFRVTGSACRPANLDVPPFVSGRVIEFVLAFSTGCFATPPAFSWSYDMVAPEPGAYEVRYLRQSWNGTLIGTPTLVHLRRIVVGMRPDAHALSNAGTVDRSFGSDGALQLPGYGLTGRILAKQPDGAVLLRDSIATRLHDDGSIDGSFPDASTNSQPLTGWFPQSLAVTSDGVIWLAGTYTAPGNSRPQLMIRRFGTVGTELSRSVFDASRLVPAPESAIGWVSAADIATLPDGKVIVAGHANDALGPISCAGLAFVARFRTDGSLDPTFGNAGVVNPLTTGCIVRATQARHGGTWLLGSFAHNTAATFLTKLDAKGDVDRSFGQAGTVFGAFARANPVEYPDGRIVLGGAGFHLVRLLPTGLVDSDFGVNGILANPTHYDLVLQDLGIDDSGGLVVAGVWNVGSAVSGMLAFRPVVIRFGSDHRWDHAFGEGGVQMPEMLLAEPTPTPIDALTLLPVAGGAWILAGIAGPLAQVFPTALFVYRFRGTANPLRAPVTEFHHLGLDHYFYTADPTEIALLDQGAISGWARTGETFSAYANLPGDASPVCRFFSSSFTPKSSHFYTGSVAECAAVGALPGWTFEGVVFSLPMPDANGACPFGSRRVYRVYNNGMGGAPAHRLTIDITSRTAMELAGWVREGNGLDGVTLCAPN